MVNSILLRLQSNEKFMKKPKFKIKIKELVLKFKKVNKTGDKHLKKLTCPNCSFELDFNGEQKCPKCEKSFQICSKVIFIENTLISQSLKLFSSKNGLICSACSFIFSEEIAKDQERCPLC